jgi:hypothetical protein
MANGRHDAIVAQLTELVTDLQRRGSGTDAGLSELVDSAARNVPGAQYAGITLASRRHGISTPAATNRYPALLDEIQQRHQDGPCLTAAWDHHTVRIDDLETEQRWPQYRRDALAETPIRSVLSFEVFVDDDNTIGALNFYADTARAFGNESEELGLIFATHIALAWGMFLRSNQFSSALASRDIIGQAKGILMERFGIDAVGAFELLKHVSQDANIKLVDIAQRVIGTATPHSSAKTTR